jgi:hypothetical protein
VAVCVTVAHSTTAWGCSPDWRHLMLANFSKPRIVIVMVNMRVVVW